MQIDCTSAPPFIQILPTGSIPPRRRIGAPLIVYVAGAPCSQWGLDHGLTTPCLHYLGGLGKDGHGFIYVNRKTVYVHRYVWQMVHGRIPKNRRVDHRCRVGRCVNVEHLRLATKRQNTLENSASASAANSTRTHCGRGHEYTARSTKFIRTRSGGRGRVCLDCRAEDLLRIMNRAILTTCHKIELLYAH